MTEPIPQTEAFIQFRLDQMSSRNEHHEFEEVATRIARKRISANILIATGPVSSGGDQQRDAETYTTRIPDKLPHAAGFSASSPRAGRGGRAAASQTPSSRGSDEHHRSPASPPSQPDWRKLAEAFSRSAQCRGRPEATGLRHAGAVSYAPPASGAAGPAMVTPKNCRSL